MIVRLGMAPRNDGTSFEQFQEHWRTSHADVVSTMPGLRGYVQLHAVLEGGVPVLPYPGFDACSALSFDDVAGMDAAFDSPTFRQDVQQDEKAFVDKTRFTCVIGDWRSALASVDALGPVVLAVLWRCGPGLAPGALADVLAERLDGTAHGLLVADHDAHEGRFPVAADVVEMTGHATVAEAAAAAGAAAPVEGASRTAHHLATTVVVVGDDHPAPTHERTTR